MEKEQSQTPNVDKLSAEVKQEAREAGASARALMDRATAHQEHVAAGDGTNGSQGGTREALMHTQGTPGKTQVALSPTDGDKGRTKSQERSLERGRGLDR